jgi:hypothetical protein
VHGEYGMIKRLLARATRERIHRHLKWSILQNQAISVARAVKAVEFLFLIFLYLESRIEYPV